MPLVGKKNGSSNAGPRCLATTSPPVLPEICAPAVPTSAENPAAVARIATVVPSLDVYIGSPSVDVGATTDAGDGGGIPGPRRLGAIDPRRLGRVRARRAGTGAPGRERQCRPRSRYARADRHHARWRH